MAVDEQPVAFGLQGGHVVQDVGEHDVEVAVVVVVGDVGHPVHRVRERLAQPAQRDDGEVLVAVPGAVEVPGPDARQHLRRTDPRDDAGVVALLHAAVEGGGELLQVGEPPDLVAVAGDPAVHGGRPPARDAAHAEHRSGEPAGDRGHGVRVAAQVDHQPHHVGEVASRSAAPTPPGRASARPRRSTRWRPPASTPVPARPPTGPGARRRPPPEPRGSPPAGRRRRGPRASARGRSRTPRRWTGRRASAPRSAGRRPW